MVWIKDKHGEWLNSKFMSRIFCYQSQICCTVQQPEAMDYVLADRFTTRKDAEDEMEKLIEILSIKEDSIVIGNALP